MGDERISKQVLEWMLQGRVFRFRWRKGITSNMQSKIIEDDWWKNGCHWMFYYLIIKMRIDENLAEHNSST